MRELSLHILDLIQNSIEAGAHNVELYINENDGGFFVFRITDDGRGMSEELLRQVRDPFTTTRLTRKVGMGIPFIDMSTSQAGGSLTLESQVGEGTVLTATFLEKHLDRPPLGNIVETLQVLLAGNPQLRLLVCYCVGSIEFDFDSAEVRRILGPNVDCSNPEVYQWLGAYLSQKIAEVRKAGRKNENIG